MPYPDRKASQRAQARAARAVLPPEVRAVSSAAIVEVLRALLPGRGLVASYAAIRDEPDLTALNEELLAAGRLVLPRVDGRVLVMVHVGRSTELRRSRFGVPEPDGPPLEPRRLAAVVVPGLAFDRFGGRIGYGAGYYDGFLPRVRPGTPLVGVCFGVCVAERIATDPHDVAVTQVVTEAGPVLPVA